MGWLRDGAFSNKSEPSLGLELETWIVDDEYKPSPINEDLIAKMDDPLIARELSKFNFEINSNPSGIHSNCFSAIHKDLEKTWKASQRAAAELNAKVMAIPA